MSEGSVLRWLHGIWTGILYLIPGRGGGHSDGHVCGLHQSVADDASSAAQLLYELLHHGGGDAIMFLIQFEALRIPEHSAMKPTTNR